MAVIKCKMCGGDMEISADKTFGTCEYCGSTMTLPKVSDDQRAAAFNRGNHFRRAGEFDKALGVYERIVAEDDTDAEAHWCCALCRFGIEYVEDPATYEWLPTCHRASFDSFLEDVDYLAALEHSDGITCRQYQKDAAKIAEVQRGILATSQNTEPYDVFISYKELDENGERTRDSVLAQDIYYQLTEQGRRVFFSRISLEDIPGTQYEPYIFAALNSSKVMIVVGTSAENLNAVWVKNEWSRFLAMMRKDKSKLLIPCYRDMDPYDMPEQLTVLMSYDMGKIGFIQDLIRGVNKVLDADKPKEKETVHETVVVKNEGGANTDALLKRGNMALEDGDWKRADEFFEQVLNQNAECAEAYLGKFLAENKYKSLDEFSTGDAGKCVSELEYEKLTACPEDTARIEKAVEENALGNYLTAGKIKKLYSFDRTYSSALESANRKIAQEKSKLDADGNYTRVRKYAASELSARMTEAEQKLFARLDERVEQCRREDKESAERISAEYAEHLDAADEQVKALRMKAASDMASTKKYGRIIAVAAAAVVLVVTVILIVTKIIIPANEYKAAEKFLTNGDYDEAISVFEALGDYKDSTERVESAVLEKAYAEAEELLSVGSKAYAAMKFASIADYKDAKERSFELWDKITQRDSISANGGYTIGMSANGTVAAVGDNTYGQRDVTIWKDIVAVSAGDYHTVGLKADGTVVATKYTGIQRDYYGQCDVSDWTDIVAVSAGGGHTVGLKFDGNVITVGDNSYGQLDVGNWENIIAISAGDYHTVGLKSNGTVVATEFTGKYNYGQCEVSDWTDIVAVSAGSFHTVGLKSDGTVLAVGYNGRGLCDVDSWTDIVAVSAGMYHTVGLKADGTVVAVGNNDYGQCDVSDWTDIVAVSAGVYHTVGLKADGTVVAVGYNKYGQCDVSYWTDIKVPER